MFFNVKNKLVAGWLLLAAVRASDVQYGDQTYTFEDFQKLTSEGIVHIMHIDNKIVIS